MTIEREALPLLGDEQVEGKKRTFLSIVEDRGYESRQQFAMMRERTKIYRANPEILEEKIKALCVEEIEPGYSFDIVVPHVENPGGGEFIVPPNMKGWPGGITINETTETVKDIHGNITHESRRDIDGVPVGNWNPRIHEGGR